MKQDQIYDLKSHRHKFVKETSMPNPFKSLGYIKCYSLSSPRPNKSSSNYIGYNCQKICHWKRRPKTILGISKKSYTSCGEKQAYYKFFKDFTNHQKNTNRVLVFSCRPLPSILQYRDHQWDFSTVWKTRLLQTHFEDFS